MTVAARRARRRPGGETHVLRPHDDHGGLRGQRAGRAQRPAGLEDGDVRVRRVAARRQDVARPEEARDGGVGRPPQHVHRPAALVHAAGDHDDALVREGEGLVAVVRDVQHRQPPLAADAAEHLLQRLPRLRVDGAERLVEQEGAGPGGERPRQRDALALAAGQRRRPAAEQVGRADGLGEPRRPPRPGRRGPPAPRRAPAPRAARMP